MITDTPHPAAETDHRKRVLDQYIETPPTLMPQHVLFEEKAHHVTLAYLMAAGRTRAEISRVLGMTLTTISTVVRQPWFQLRLKAITEESGKDMVKAFLEGEVLPSLEVLRTIRDDVSQKGPTRVIAADKILDRFLGKPMVHVESKTNLNIHTAAETVEQVQRELASINDELSTRGVKLSTTGNN